MTLIPGSPCIGGALYAPETGGPVVVSLHAGSVEIDLPALREYITRLDRLADQLASVNA